MQRERAGSEERRERLRVIRHKFGASREYTPEDLDVLMDTDRHLDRVLRHWSRCGIGCECPEWKHDPEWEPRPW